MSVGDVSLLEFVLTAFAGVWVVFFTISKFTSKLTLPKFLNGGKRGEDARGLAKLDKLIALSQESIEAQKRSTEVQQRIVDLTTELCTSTKINEERDKSVKEQLGRIETVANTIRDRGEQ